MRALKRETTLPFAFVSGALCTTPHFRLAKDGRPRWHRG
jgi:hypothetical protein